jgi:hypothetical protein
MSRPRIGQCWKLRQVGLRVSEKRDPSQGYIWMLFEIRSVLA